MGYMLMPAIISSVIDKFEISTHQAGLTASCLLGSLALAMFITTPFLTRLDSIKICRFGCAVVIVGYAFAAIAPNLVTVIIALSLAGAGMGVSIAGGDAIVSSRDNPDRLFAFIFALGQFTAFVLLIAFIPKATQIAGFTGLCCVLAVWSLLMLISLFMSRGEVKTEDSTYVHGSSTLSLFIVPIVIALFAIGFSDASVWPFTGEVGMSVGLNETDAQAIQGLALLAGIVGATLAGILSDRIGRKIPLAAGLVVLAAMYFSVLTAQTVFVYAAAQIIALFFYGFSIPYLFGISSELDSSGQIMATASGMQMLGVAVAPWIAGILIAGPGLSAVGIVVAGAVFLTLILAFRSQSKISKSTQED